VLLSEEQRALAQRLHLRPQLLQPPLSANKTPPPVSDSPPPHPPRCHTETPRRIQGAQDPGLVGERNIHLMTNSHKSVGGAEG
jgi:hypothetical protein